MAQRNKKLIMSTLATTAFAGALYLMAEKTSDQDMIDPALDTPHPNADAIITAPQDSIADLPAPPPKEQRIASIFFDNGSNDLRPAEQEFVADIAAYLKDTGETFEVRGCTSRSGNAHDNFTLSYRRAYTVFNEIGKHGVPISPWTLPDRQNGDIYGMGIDCPPLDDPDSTRSKTASMQRADIIINPEL